MLIVLNIKRPIIINSEKQRRRIASAQLPLIVSACGARLSKKENLGVTEGRLGEIADKISLLSRRRDAGRQRGTLSTHFDHSRSAGDG
jgi:hypothetical protein